VTAEKASRGKSKQELETNFFCFQFYRKTSLGSSLQSANTEKKFENFFYFEQLPGVLDVDGDGSRIGHVSEPAVVRGDRLGYVEALLDVGHAHVHVVVL
jgi:hypothetical protein